MGRKNGSGGMHVTTKQKGKSKRGGIGTYARQQKGRKADRYDRPYLDGTYSRESLGE